MFSSRVRAWRVVACGLAIVVVPVLVWLGIGAASSSASSVVAHPFAGIWNTSTGGVAGTLQINYQTPSQGAASTAYESGGAASCVSGATYYAGGYQWGSGASEIGQIAGCSDANGDQLTLWFNSSDGSQQGTVKITIGAGDTSFSGTYTNTASDTAGSYTGTFDSDFNGSGRYATTSSSCSTKIDRALASSADSSTASCEVQTVKFGLKLVDVKLASNGSSKAKHFEETTLQGTGKLLIPADKAKQPDAIGVSGTLRLLVVKVGGKGLITIDDFTLAVLSGHYSRSSGLVSIGVEVTESNPEETTECVEGTEGKISLADGASTHQPDFASVSITGCGHYFEIFRNGKNDALVIAVVQVGKPASST